jgi:DNA-binding SARP family transcriptional activator
MRGAIGIAADVPAARDAGAEGHTAEPSILVCLLGSFRLLKRGEPIALRGGGKAESLLTSLALSRGYGLRREALVGTLWPNVEVDLANQSLRSLVYSMHRLVGPELGGAPPVLHVADQYRLNTGAGIGVDVAVFERLASGGSRRDRAADPGGAASLYARAVELYAGDLCVGADVHALIERERLRALHQNVLARLADYHFGAGRYEESLERALALLAGEPCREDAHRLAMRCYARLGQRVQAMRQYRLCTMILRAEFDTEPEPSTTALFDQLRLDPSRV